MRVLCEVCLQEQECTTIDLGSHPLNDDMRPIGNKSPASRYPQEIWLCRFCLTAHQVHLVKKETLFFPEYRYRGSLTKDVVEGMRDLVGQTLRHISHVDKLKILDVGCNDGTLLGLFKEALSDNVETWGVDPTDAIQDNKGRIDRIKQEFFDESVAESVLEEHGFPDVITFTNSFAHIEDLDSVLKALLKLIDSNNLLVIENHYLGSILERNQFDTFYAEHIRTYSARSFKFIADRLNANLISVQFPKRYGGNIRAFISRKMPEKKEDVNLENQETEAEFLTTFFDLERVYEEWKFQSISKIDELSQSGALVGKSCPARSVMLFSSLELTAAKMSRVFEHPKSPKIGNYVPGTDIPIVSDEVLSTTKAGNMILWSWHIADEIVPYLKGTGFKGTIWSPLPSFKKIATL